MLQIHQHFCDCMGQFDDDSDDIVLGPKKRDCTNVGDDGDVGDVDGQKDPEDKMTRGEVEGGAGQRQRHRLTAISQSDF